MTVTVSPKTTVARASVSEQDWERARRSGERRGGWRGDVAPPAKRTRRRRSAAGDAATGCGDDEANAGAANASRQIVTASSARAMERGRARRGVV